MRGALARTRPASVPTQSPPWRSWNDKSMATCHGAVERGYTPLHPYIKNLFQGLRESVGVNRMISPNFDEFTRWQPSDKNRVS